MSIQPPVTAAKSTNMTEKEALDIILNIDRHITISNQICPKHNKIHKYGFKWTSNPFLLFIEYSYYGCDTIKDLTEFAYSLLLEDMRKRLRKGLNY